MIFVKKHQFQNIVAKILTKHQFRYIVIKIETKYQFHYIVAKIETKHQFQDIVMIFVTKHQNRYKTSNRDKTSISIHCMKIVYRYKKYIVRTKI